MQPTGAFVSRASLRVATASRRPRRITRPPGWPTSSPAAPGCGSSSPVVDVVCPAASAIAAHVLAPAPRFGWRAAWVTTAMSFSSKARTTAVGTPGFPRVSIPPMRFSDPAPRPRREPCRRNGILSIWYWTPSGLRAHRRRQSSIGSARTRFHSPQSSRVRALRISRRFAPSWEMRAPLASVKRRTARARSSS